MVKFLLRSADAMRSADYAVVRCPSVCPSQWLQRCNA